MGNTRNEQVLGEAASWHARLGAPDCTDGERAEFERWWLAAPAHARAFAAAEAISAEVSCAAAPGSRLQQLADEAFAMGRSASPACPEDELARKRAQFLDARGARRRWFVP